MVYRGIVRNGVVVIDGGVKLPDGTAVRIEPLAQPGASPPEGPTLVEQLRNVIGAVPELPSDMADSHDHYLHGAPRR